MNELIKMQAQKAMTSPTVLPIVRDVLRSSGKPLDPATRAFMGPRFGHDFSQVRVHAGTRAAKSARAINALAYTVGNEIVFAEYEYGPNTGNKPAPIPDVRIMITVYLLKFKPGDLARQIQNLFRLI